MPNSYPPQAVPRGTFVRSNSLNRLGVVTSAVFQDKQLYYTSFYFPNTAPGLYHYNLMARNDDGTVHGLVAEESEFDLTFYLMIGPVNLDEIDFYDMPGEIVL
tara:strand:+ start:6769 stop:7077 length:309 start_codon:yes stop_codon:yes gene_type:complete